MDATIHLHSAFNVGPVDQRIFGGFVEHLGRAVYGGLYEPNHPLADEHGVRSDVYQALNQLRMTTMRYPGGDFASGYHWLDGVGEKTKRPTVHDRAWNALETNQFGTDEFLSLSERIGWNPMITVNLGSGSPEEARDWLEYCNQDRGGRFSELRREHGRKLPYEVLLWCLGNELNGEWQIGYTNPEEYCRRAKETARLMKDVDPRIELAVCGSCTPNSPSYLDWDREVLEGCFEEADYLSIHRYAYRDDNSPEDFLYVGASFDEQIEGASAICESVRLRRKSRHKVRLSFDEWNVWQAAGDARRATAGGEAAQPLLEETYTLEDALVVGQFLNSFIRHADSVKIANLAQIVNVLAPLRVSPHGVLKQATAHVFEMFSRTCTGTSLKISCEVAKRSTKLYGSVSSLDCSAVIDGDRLRIYLVNRSTEEAIEARIEFADAAIIREKNGALLFGKCLGAKNTFEEPHAAANANYREAHVKHGRATVTLPPASLYHGEFELDREPVEPRRSPSGVPEPAN